jgi:hypothetical protein
VTAEEPEMPTVLVLLAVLFAPDGTATAKASTMPDAKTCEQYAAMLRLQVESLEPSAGTLQTFCIDVAPHTKPALYEVPRDQ